MSYRAPMRSACLNKYRIKRGWYKCALCHGTFRKSEISIDHIQPVVAVTGFAGFDEYIKRLFCPADGLQAACDTCHTAKTKAENQLRKMHAKKRREH